MEASERHLGVHIVRNDDAEEFALELADAVAKCSAAGPPSIAFSHTANGEGGYNYAAVVTGMSDPDSEVTVTDKRTEGD